MLCETEAKATWLEVAAGGLLQPQNSVTTLAVVVVQVAIIIICEIIDDLNQLASSLVTHITTISSEYSPIMKVITPK